jgi:hypothetical protein
MSIDSTIDALLDQQIGQATAKDKDPVSDIDKQIDDLLLTQEVQTTEQQPVRTGRGEQARAEARDDPVKLALLSAGQVAEDVGVGVIRAGLDTAQEVYKAALELGSTAQKALGNESMAEMISKEAKKKSASIDIEREQFARVLTPETKAVSDRSSALVKFAGPLVAAGPGGALTQAARGAGVGALSATAARGTEDDSTLRRIATGAGIGGVLGGAVGGISKGIQGVRNFFNSRDKALIELSEEIAKNPKFQDTVKAAQRVGAQLTPEQALPGSLKTQVRGKDIARAIPDIDDALVQQEQILKSNDSKIFSFFNRIFNKADKFDEGIDNQIVSDISSKVDSANAAAKAEALIRSKKAYDVVNASQISDDALLKLMNTNDEVGQKIVETVKIARQGSANNGSDFVKFFADKSGLKSGGVWTNVKRYLDDMGRNDNEARLAADRIKTVIDKELPMFKEARELYKQGFNEHLSRISPKLNQILGRKNLDFKVLARNLFDDSQDLNDFKAVRDLIQQQDPALWMSAINNHISKTLHKASTPRVGKWADQIDKLFFKNKAQVKLLETALEQHPMKLQGLRDLVKVTGAITKKEAAQIASSTATDSAVGRVAGGIGAGAITGGAVAGAPGAAVGGLAGGVFRSGLIDDMFRAMRTRALVKLYLDPKWISDAQRIVDIKRKQGVGAAAKALTALFASTGGTLLGEDKDEQNGR